MANLRPEQFRQSIQSTRELTEYFRKVVADRRVHPREDLLTALARAEEQGDRLNEARFAAWVKQASRLPGERM